MTQSPSVSGPSIVSGAAPDAGGGVGLDRMMDRVGFVHLRVHSALSLLEGALPIKKLLDLAKSDDQPALAITDTGNAP